MAFNPEVVFLCWLIRCEHPALAPEVMKADQIANQVKERFDRHRTCGGTFRLWLTLGATKNPTTVSGT